MRISRQIMTTGFDGKPSNPMVDLRYGAQGGYMPAIARDLDGKQFEEYLSNASHVSMNLVPFCLRTPKIFDILEDKDLGAKLKSIYIDLFTIQPISITGFNRTITLETVGHRIGSLEEEQEEVVRATKTRSQITYEFEDKLGEATSRFLEFLSSYAIMDYRTGSALISTLKVGDEFRKGNLYTPDYYSATMMYVELDRVNVNVQNAYIDYVFYPKSTGELTNQRKLGEALPTPILSVPCAGIILSDETTKAYAQKYVDNVSILRTNPDEVMRIAVTEAEANAMSSLNGGYNVDGYNTTVDGFDDNTQTAFGKQE